MSQYEQFQDEKIEVKQATKTHKPNQASFDSLGRPSKDIVRKTKDHIKLYTSDFLIEKKEFEKEEREMQRRKKFYQFKYVHLKKIILFYRVAIRLFFIIIFNCSIAYLLYLPVSLFRFVQYIKTYNDHKLFSKRILALQFCKDFVLSVCVILMYLIFLVSLKEPFMTVPDYFDWSTNCIFFIVLFTSFVTYKEVHAKQEHEFNTVEKQEPLSDKYQFMIHWSYLFSDDNFHSLSLGQFQSDYLKQMLYESEDQHAYYKHSFAQQVKSIFHQENLDETLNYFSLAHDESTLQKSMKKSVSVAHGNIIDQLKQIGFRGHRHILKDFLLPYYIFTKEKYKYPPQSAKNLVLLVIIIFKIIFPTIVFIRPIDLLVIPYTLIFAGFYLHFYPIICTMLTNDDLKVKTYMFKALLKIVTLKSDSGKETEEVQEKEEKSKPKEQDIMLDISCPLSLQSWNNMRNLILQLDKKEKKHYNIIFACLAIYGKICFVGFLVCRLKIPLSSSINFCDKPILYYNIHIDIALVLAVCMVRIYEGSQFNEIFDQIREMMQRLSAVYEDLYTLFDFYFLPPRENEMNLVEQIHNKLIKSVIEMIQEAAHLKFLSLAPNSQSSDLKQAYYDVELDDQLIQSKEHKLCEQKVEELKEATNKILLEVDHDEIRFAEKFLGMIGTDFKKALKIVLIVALSFVPSLFSKLSKLIDLMT